tara:strand:+ start:1347 stop:1523 length:177 start_codon:yes stop_codon:yes gene_type:complete
MSVIYFTFVFKKQKSKKSKQKRKKNKRKRKKGCSLCTIDTHIDTHTFTSFFFVASKGN